MDVFDPDDLTEEELLTINVHWTEDLKYAWLEARWVGLAAAIALALLVYQLLTSYPLPTPRVTSPAPSLRPFLHPHEVHSIRNDVQSSQTTFHIHGSSYSLRHFKSVSNDGTFHPPGIFYQGVFFGLIENSSHRYEYLRNQSISILRRNVSSEMELLHPTPTSVHRRVSQHDNGFVETGYGIHYSFDDLKNQGMHSSDTKQPWKRILVKIIDLGVKLDVPYVLIWHPNYYGKKNGLRYEHIVQTIVPTRTGYGSLRNSRAVWLSAINNTIPKREPLVYRKEWTPDDHWTHYPFDSEPEL